MRWRKKRIRKIAQKSIKKLFELAEKEYNENPDRAHRYIEIARNISMRTRVLIPKHLKRRICKNCHHFLKYGENCRVRTKNTKIVVTCLDCGCIMRFPFVREKKAQKS
ncbi:MAG: ribonuclease P protein component 4 [Candidatus Methanofastidiosia archaeon]|jgi:ribonuclease P protein subunit RPR2